MVRRKYADVIADLKQRLKTLRKDVGEDDSKHPHIQEVIETHWQD